MAAFLLNATKSKKTKMAQTATKGKETKEKRAPREKFVTPVGRFTFLHIYKPDSEGQFADDKFKATILVRNEDRESLKLLKQLMLKTAREKWGESVKYSELETPFKDGDEKFEENNKFEAFKDTIYFIAKSQRAPGIVGPDLKALSDGDILASGDYGRMSVTCYAYERPGTVIEMVNGKRKETKMQIKGIAFNLEHLQKAKTGERFGGGGAPENDFTEIEVEDEPTSSASGSDDETFEEKLESSGSSDTADTSGNDDDDLI